MKTHPISRRNFLRNTAISTGMASLAPFGITGSSFGRNLTEDNFSREVWIAGVSQMWLTAGTAELMTDKILNILKEVVPYHPDFVCLPEVFPFEMIEKKYTMAEKLEISGQGYFEASNDSILTFISWNM